MAVKIVRMAYPLNEEWSLATASLHNCEVVRHAGWRRQTAVHKAKQKFVI